MPQEHGDLFGRSLLRGGSLDNAPAACNLLQALLQGRRIVRRNPAGEQNRCLRAREVTFGFQEVSFGRCRACNSRECRCDLGSES